MKAEIITIGDELLIGQTIDTNSAWIAKELNHLGISVFQITSISDERQHILKALQEAEERVDLVLITGGLGPTKDDITKQVLCEYFDTSLIIHQETFDFISSYMERMNLPMLEVNRQQAMVPKSCQVIMNHRGSAPGMWFEKNSKAFISMPGVPYEMKGLMRDEVLSKIQDFFKTPHIYHQTFLTHGVGESFLAERIAVWEDSLTSEGIKLAYLPSPGIVKLRLSVFGTDDESMKQKVEQKKLELLELIPDVIFGYNRDTLESVIGQLLLEKDASLSIAESCTGGKVASMITSIAGSSQYFLGGIVSYSEKMKMNSLGVEEQTLQKFGAVSEQVAIQMAEGIKTNTGSSYSIATTGIAGPDGGNSDNPVGTVWIAIATPKGTISQRHMFTSNRSGVILRSTLMALNMLRLEILDTRT